MARNNQAYLERRQQFLEAIAIGEKIVPKSKLSASEKKQTLGFYKEMKELAENPEKGHENVRSLAYLEEAYLTQWNEGIGKEVELFWKEVEKKSLPYERKDVIEEVLSRKKIKDEHEYDTIKDGIVIAEQTGKITSKQAKELSKYLSDFEIKLSKRRR